MTAPSPIQIDSQLYLEAKSLLYKTRGKPSVSLLQRTFRLGYSTACSLMKLFEIRGVVTPPDVDGHWSLVVDYAPTTKIINNWRTTLENENDKLTKSLIDVSGILNFLRSYSPKKITFSTLAHAPCIHLGFQDVVTPQLVIDIGLEIQHQLEMPVYFSSLKLRQITYVVEGNFPMKKNESQPSDAVASQRYPLTALAAQWGLG